jgi:hypothetical protein
LKFKINEYAFLERDKSDFFACKGILPAVDAVAGSVRKRNDQTAWDIQQQHGAAAKHSCKNMGLGSTL